MFKYLIIFGVLICASATAQKLENSAVNGEVCTVCTEVLISTKALLSQNLTDQEIISYISIAICYKLGPFARLCRQIIQDNGPKILQQIAQDIEPEDICYQLFLCSTVKNSDFKANTILCDSCIEVFNTTKELLSQNTTDTEIVKYVSVAICYPLGPLAGPCRKYIQSNGVIILQKLSEDIEPLTLCQVIFICSKTLDIDFNKRLEKN